MTGETLMKVGEYYSFNDQLDVSRWATMRWPDADAPPRDGSVKKYELFRLPAAQSVTLKAITTCGILLALFFLAVNVKFRNHQ